MRNAGYVVHVVDDDQAVRQSMRFMLREAGFVVETYASGAGFLAAIDRATTGCLLLDIRMPGIDGLEVQDMLAHRGIVMPVIMMTGHGAVSIAVRAIKSGAIDFLEKPFAREVLIAAVEAAFDRAARLERDAVAGIDAQKRLAVLTRREREVLLGLVRGRPNKLIAFDLGIAARTVEVHRANVMEKLCARSLADILKIAFAAGLGATEDDPVATIT